MKKLLFVLAFIFIGSQSFSQIYLANIVSFNAYPSAGCSTEEVVLIKNPPIGNQTTTCINYNVHNGGLITLNQELNSIVSQGYKLISTSFAEKGEPGVGSLVYYDATSGAAYINWRGVSFIFAIPWSANGLEEVATTLKSFLISPNPANTFVDISLDYSLKGESEVVFISEASYIYHKQSISNISKNEKYNIDISKIPAGKYLVTIVNGKTYTTPQRLIVK